MDAAREHEPTVAGGLTYASIQPRGPAWAFALLMAFALAAWCVPTVFFLLGSLVPLGLADVLLTFGLVAALWPHAVLGQMAVRCDAHGMQVTFGPLGTRRLFLPHGSITEVRPIEACGQRWAKPSDGTLCPYGRGHRPGVRLTLSEPWGPGELTEVTIVVPDPERLAGSLHERTHRHGA